MNDPIMGSSWRGGSGGRWDWTRWGNRRAPRQSRSRGWADRPAAWASTRKPETGRSAEPAP